MRAAASPCWIVVGKVALGQVFLRVLTFALSILPHQCFVLIHLHVSNLICPSSGSTVTVYDCSLIYWSPACRRTARNWTYSSSTCNRPIYQGTVIYCYCTPCLWATRARNI